MIEKWRPVPGYAHYEVSTFGRVRSVDHVDSMGRKRPGRILRQVSDGKGNYLYVTLTSPIGARKESVHRIVASRSHNNSYGGHLQGERNHQAKLKEHEARYIKEHPEEGTTNLAKKFGISLAQTSAIIHGIRWGWL